MSRYPRPSYTPTATRPPQAPRSHSGPANHSMANFYKNTTAEMGNLICKRTLGLDLYSCNIFYYPPFIRLEIYLSMLSLQIVVIQDAVPADFPHVLVLLHTKIR